MPPRGEQSSLKTKFSPMQISENVFWVLLIALYAQFSSHLPKMKCESKSWSFMRVILGFGDGCATGEATFSFWGEEDTMTNACG